MSTDNQGNEIRVRLIGINAPESRANRHRDVEYFGKESKDFLTNLIEGRIVALEFDEKNITGLAGFWHIFI